jgi:hypothetical protein
MLGLSSSLVKGGMTGRAYVRDGLKLYMPYKGANIWKGTQFVGTGSTSFDGHSDYIATGTDIADDLGDGYAGALTITMWFKFTGASGGSDDGMFQMAPVDDWTTRPIMLRHHGNLIYFRTADSSAVSTAYTETNVWRHLTCIADRPKAELRIYLDGVLKNTDSMGQDLDLDGLTTYIGVYAAPQYAFTGKIKNVALWNRALTATEIQNVMYKSYAEVSGRLKDNLMSWKALDGEVGSDGNAGSEYILDEVSGAGSTTNLGTITNAVVNTDLYGGDTPVKPRGIDNAPTVQADAIGAGSASFNGSSDYISLGNDSSLQVGTSDFSWCAWIYRTADDGAIFNWGDIASPPAWQLYENGAELLRLRIDDGGGGLNSYSSTALPEDEWVHVCLTMDRDSATGIKMYFNGIDVGVDEDDATGQQLTLSGGSVGAYIGVRQAGGFAAYHPGNICQVGLWTAVLTQAQIQSIMEKTYEELIATEKTNLVSYWALDETLALSGSGASFVNDKVDESPDELWDTDKQSNGDLTGWSTYGTNTKETEDSAVKITYVDNDDGAYLEMRTSSQLTREPVTGKRYKLQVDAKVNTSNVTLRAYHGGSPSVTDQSCSNTAEFQTFTFYFEIENADPKQTYLRAQHMGVGEIIWMKNFSFKEYQGNVGRLI